MVKNIVKDMSVKDLVNLVSSYLNEIKEYEDFIECLINDEDRRDKKISNTGYESLWKMMTLISI